MLTSTSSLSRVCASYTACAPLSGSARVCRQTGRRLFSTTSPIYADHYQTLGIPRDASRAQVKSSFYRLSKELHPDANPDGGDKEKWLALTEAYRTLGDDRRRRTYDRELSVGTSSWSATKGSSFPSHPAYHSANYERPKHRATYAWERHRPASRPAHSDFASARTQHHANSSSHLHQRTNQHGIPHSSGRTYYRRTNPADHEPVVESDEDRVNATNFLWRFLGVGAFTVGLFSVLKR